MPLTPEIQVTPSSKPSQTRRVGLNLPIQSNSFGGMSRVSGNENNVKTIAIALGSLENENAFQQPESNMNSALFEIGDEAAMAFVRRNLTLTFEEFERQHRFRLLKNTVQFRQNEEGDMFIDFQYHDLESDQIENMSHAVGAR